MASTFAWLSMLLIHGSELLIKQRRVVKCFWEDSFGCILEKLGQPEATITKKSVLSFCVSSLSAFMYASLWKRKDLDL